MKQLIALVFIIVGVHFFNIEINAQSLTWQRLYNSPYNFNDESKDMCVADNDNFFVVGSAFQNGATGQNIYVLKLKPNGDTIWTRVYGDHSRETAYSCVSSGDGGCVMAGEQDSCFIMKINSNGSIVWKKYYGDRTVILNDIIKTSDGGYIACGRINGTIRDGYIIKVDSIGNFQWKKIFTGSFNKIFYSIILDIDKYVLAGYLSDSELSNPKGLIVKLNLQGSLIWSKTFSVSKRATVVNKIIETNSSYLLSGITSDDLGTRNQIFIARSDTSGNNYFSEVIDSEYRETMQDFVFINNRIIITCDLDSNFSNFKYIAKVYAIDTTGQVITSNSFSTSDYSRLRRILPATTGDLIFAGYTDTYSPNDEDIYIIRTDSTLFAKPLSIKSNVTGLPEQWTLFQNYPNPFNSLTSIKFELNQKSTIKIKVFDLRGKFLKTLINSTLPRGIYKVNFDASELPSGVYPYVIYSSDSKSKTKFMVLIK